MHPVMPESGYYFAPKFCESFYCGFSLNNTTLVAAQLKKLSFDLCWFNFYFMLDSIHVTRLII